MSQNEIGDITKRIIEFYSRACTKARIGVHIVSASYIYEGRTIRDGEFIAKVVVVDHDNEDKVICTLAQKEGHSPQGALNALFDSYDGPIYKSVVGIKEINTCYVDVFTVELGKDGTKVFAENANKIEKLREDILEMQELRDL